MEVMVLAQETQTIMELLVQEVVEVVHTTALVLTQEILQTQVVIVVLVTAALVVVEMQDLQM